MPSGPGALCGDNFIKIFKTPSVFMTNDGTSGSSLPGTFGGFEEGSVGSLVKTDLYWLLSTSALSWAELTSWVPFHRAAIPHASRRLFLMNDQKRLGSSFRDSKTSVERYSRSAFLSCFWSCFLIER